MVPQACASPWALQSVRVLLIGINRIASHYFRMSFLEQLSPRPLTQTVAGLAPTGLCIGPAILASKWLFTALRLVRPRECCRKLVKARRGTCAAPVLVVALYDDRAWVCGPSGENLPIQADKDPGSIERLCAAALKQPDRHGALIFLNQALPSLDTPAPGLRNEGLFALHELTNDVPRRPEWNEHQIRARAAIGAGGARSASQAWVHN